MKESGSKIHLPSIAKERAQKTAANAPAPPYCRTREARTFPRLQLSTPISKCSRAFEGSKDRLLEFERKPTREMIHTRVSCSESQNKKNNLRVHVAGERARLGSDCQETCSFSQSATSRNTLSVCTPFYPCPPTSKTPNRCEILRKRRCRHTGHHRNSRPTWRSSTQFIFLGSSSTHLTHLE